MSKGELFLKKMVDGTRILPFNVAKFNEVILTNDYRLPTNAYSKTFSSLEILVKLLFWRISLARFR